MKPDGRAKPLGAGGDRPVAVAPTGLMRPGTDIDLHIWSGLGTALDRGDGGLGVTPPRQDRGLQPRVAVGPVGELPFVDGALDRGTEIQILLRENKEIENLQNA